jgi:hypothetical protein
MPHEMREEVVQGESRAPSGNRVSAYEAAEIFGVTVDAIRKRIQRGAVPHERDDRRVLLDACSTVRDLDQDDYWMTTSDGYVCFGLPRGPYSKKTAWSSRVGYAFGNS